MVTGVRVIRVKMVAKLAEVKQERNAALLKVIEKEGVIGRLSKQLQSECRVLVLSAPFPRTHCQGVRPDSPPCPCLAEVDEGHNDCGRVGRQMHQLDSVELQQPAQEVARGDAELCGESSSPKEGVDINVPLRGAPGRLILAGVPWVTSWFPSILLGYNMESLSELDYLVLYTKLSSCLWAHKSGRAGSTDRSAGLLVGQARLSGTAETLVGGDPWVPMSHKLPIDV
jgi:hypothetical protein